MGKMIIVGSVTYAMKGKDLLFEKGIKAYIERTKRTKEYGCGYGIVVADEIEAALAVLKKNNVNILAVIDE